jgi:hypothetical protein
MNKRSVSLNDFTSYLKINKNTNNSQILNNNDNILLIYYIDYIRNYNTLNDDMIKNIVNFNDENKIKIIKELVKTNKSLLDYVIESDDDKD